MFIMPGTRHLLKNQIPCRCNFLVACILKTERVQLAQASASGFSSLCLENLNPQAEACATVNPTLTIKWLAQTHESLQTPRATFSCTPEWPFQLKRKG